MHVRVGRRENEKKKICARTRDRIRIHVNRSKFGFGVKI